MKNITLVEQMELGLQNRDSSARKRARSRERTPSRWWFSQMRKVVDRATDWQPRPAPRPLQERLALPWAHDK